jgi:signal transduction histidine kinase
MLESLAKAANAYGCILWQVVPGSNLDGDKPSGYLFVLAEWFPDEKRDPLHNLPLEKSITGSVVLNNTFMSVSDIKDPRVFEDPFLAEAGIQAFCSMPIKFRGGSKRGAVNVYRREAIPFDSKDEEQLKQLSLLIPEIYKSIRDKVNFSVMRKVNRILHRAELRAGSGPLTKSEVQKDIQKICNVVSNTFQCVETSIYLEDRREAPGNYDLMATTWPQDEEKLRSRYRRSKDDGITGWILKEAKPVTIFDLHYFDTDRERILRDYPGLKWSDDRKIENVVRKIRGLEEEKPLPPLSFMGAPIVMGKEVLGAIRCSVAQQGPYYFADLALGLLRLVAAQISRYWSNWLAQREKQDEIISWQELIKSVGELNSFVLIELSEEAPNEQRIFAKALHISQSVIRGAEIIDVRLIDESTDELYYAQTEGDLWSEGSQEEIEHRKKRRFKLKEAKPTSAGAYVVQTGEVYLIPDVTDKKYVYGGAFADTKRLIVAPIKVANKIYGVLDIRGTGEAQFPRYAAEIAGLLGQQLGLYKFLATSTRKLRKTQAVLRETISELRNTKLDLEMNINELKRFEAQQIQILENLQHQLKSPLIPALDRFQKLLRSAESGSKLESDLLDIRGIFRRFRRVAMSTDLFASIAKGENLRIKPRVLECDNFVSTLIAYAKDSRFSVDPDREIRFHVDEESFTVLKTRIVQADANLLEQAVMNLLDNAGKYSSNKTQVRIYGGLTSGGRFHITVANKGLKIRSEDIARCKTKGWRSEQAQATTGEGSGIGLWLVDHIMRSHHGGELEIKATTPENVTEVRLLFSASTEGKHNAHLIS